MTDQSPVFESLSLAGWRQFGSVSMSFHPHLTIITGVNGAGKSTLLNVLSRHLGVERPYLSSLRRGRDGKLQYVSSLFTIPRRLQALVGWHKASKLQIGELSYTNGVSAVLEVPEGVGLNYGLTLNRQQSVLGLHIPSHRLMPVHKSIANLEFSGVDPDSAFQRLINPSNTHWLGGDSRSSVIFELKKILAAWATVGEGNSIIVSDVRQRDAYEGFKDILKKVIPREIGFLDFSIQPPEISLVTRSGTFLIDAASGGLTTLIEVAAMIYSCSIRSDVKGRKFVVTMDEPENHLHPSLQRSLLPLLVAAFPDVQFVVATHSPVIVSAVKDSKVYALKYEKLQYGNSDEVLADSAIESVCLDLADRAGSASEILREVLGVPVTLPLWVEAELSAIVAKFRNAPMSEDSLGNMREELKQSGLGDLFPEALANLSRDQ